MTVAAARRVSPASSPALPCLGERLSVRGLKLSCRLHDQKKEPMKQDTLIDYVVKGWFVTFALVVFAVILSLVLHHT